MHKILTLAIILLADAVVISAQTLVKEMDVADTRFIPGQYMKNGEAAIYFSSNEYGYNDENGSQYEAAIYDFELKLLKTFKFSILEPYTIHEEKATSGTREKTRVLRDEQQTITSLPDVSDMEARKEAFIDYIFERESIHNPNMTRESLTNSCRVDGTTVYVAIPINPRLTYRYEQYLTFIEAYVESTNIYGYEWTYSMQVPVCNGEWTTNTWYDAPISNFCTPRCIDVAKLNDWSGGVYLPFSQTFFNDDEKFEYVRLKALIAEGSSIDSDVSNSQSTAEELLFGVTANDRDGDGEIDYRSTYYSVHVTGLEVVNEDNEVIYTFPMPDNCEGKASVVFYKSDNSILAQVDYEWHNDIDEYTRTTRFYRIDKTNSGVAQLVKEENHLIARPNPVSNGSPVVVELAPALHERIIRVNSLDGSMVKSLKINANATSTTVPTDNLKSGMYLINVIDNSHVTEACKIIVK